MVGSEARFPLESRVGAGYLWQVSYLEGKREAACVSIETDPLPGQGTLPSNLPAPTQRVVSGLRTGSALWRIQVVRPWMSDIPLVDHNFQVLVK